MSEPLTDTCVNRRYFINPMDTNEDEEKSKKKQQEKVFFFFPSFIIIKVVYVNNIENFRSYRRKRITNDDRKKNVYICLNISVNHYASEKVYDRNNQLVAFFIEIIKIDEQEPTRYSNQSCQPFLHAHISIDDS